jgi:hypothetical protein
MAKDLRGGLGSLSAKLNRRIDRSLARRAPGNENATIGDMPRGGDLDLASRATLSMDLAPEDPLATLADRLDIGASAYAAGPTHSFDIDINHVPVLLTAVARNAKERGQRAYLQLPGRCHALTKSSVGRCVAGIDGRPRLRLLITDDRASLAENIAIELWKQADRAYRSLSDDAAIRLSIPDAAPPRYGPASTEDHVDVPIDVVYTWVDATDTTWRSMAAPYLDLESLDGDRFVQNDELRYSLRSVDVFAPWVNHIYVLSNCSPPEWFAASDRVSWVSHDQVADPELLPLFNSGAIDTLVHRIPGLSEHFLYLNDDFLLWDSVTPATFFTWDDRTIARLATNSSVIYLQQMVEAGRGVPQMHSRVNAARLLQERMGIFPTHLHGHVPYALRRSFMEQIEQDFPDEIAATRSSRIRSDTDVSFVAYLYHHYAYAHGKGVYVDAPKSYVTLQNYQNGPMRRALRQSPFVCFQDSRGSADDTTYQSFKREMLENALPLRSSAEVHRR